MEQLRPLVRRQPFPATTTQVQRSAETHRCKASAPHLSAAQKGGLKPMHLN
jgi:hypothetical protein